ncbi:hypothetical protein [Paenibacillus ferrarius]|uniref:hypothetical protein n=1 Tax=Paenibacillus ferrarius TaxID=1469647 RepID=UPI003D2AFF4E
MTLPLITLSALAAAGLYSLRFLRISFLTVEIAAAFMILCSLIIEVYGLITLNLDLLNHSSTFTGYWYINLYLLILVPCVTVWLIAALFSPAVPFFAKGLLIATWLCGNYGGELLMNAWGIRTFDHWNMAYSFLDWLILLTLSVCFIYGFRKMWRKQVSR